MTAQTQIAFKDWSLVCAALAQGRQNVILRKGGIAEGRGGFQFKHTEFWLFPTRFHQQTQMVRDPAAQLPTPAEGFVEIRSLFKVERAVWLDDWDAVQRLAGLHILREEVLSERFAYAEPPGLQCAFGRVWNLDAPWKIGERPAYGGCRSWITLADAPPQSALSPALLDEEHRRASDEFEAATDQAATSSK